MKLLLIGHEGYVGSGLFRFLENRHEVIGWGKKDNISNITKDVIFENGISAIINCATIVDRVNKIFPIDSPTAAVNIDGLKTIVSAISGTSVKLIQISTKDVYGMVYNEKNTRELPKHYELFNRVDDGKPFDPQTAYGKSKLIAEYIAECHPLTTTIRLSSCYTDHDHYRGHWLLNMIKRIQQDKPVRLFNKGKQVRDLLHVNDLGRLIDKILNEMHFGIRLNAGGGILNTYSILQIIEMIDSKAKLEFSEGDDFGFAFNNRMVSDKVGWSPTIQLKDRLSIIQNNLSLL